MTMKKLSISPSTAGLFLSLMLWMSVIVAKQDTPKFQSTNQEKVNVSISKWEYCEGCKETVNLYTRVLSNKLLSMHNGGVKAHSELIAEDLVNGICDSEDLVKYKDFVKYSCIKIMDNHNSVFLKQFEGTSSPTNVLNKALVFERKKHICFHVKACNESVFVDTLTAQSSKKCQACESIARDIEIAKRLLNVTSSDKKGDKMKKKDGKLSLRDHLEDRFCSSLGYNHQPYSWLEATCDEMLDDHIDQILDVLRFHDQVGATGLTPSQSFPEMLCGELYGCGKKSSQAKSKSKSRGEKEL